MMEFRDYQRTAIDALYTYFSGSAGNPLVVMPTGTGKSVVIAGFVREAIEAWGDTRILILTHVKELIQQNFMALLRAWPEAPAGIYSAGLSRRDIHAQVLFAGIQSIHKHAAKVQRCDLVLIDEAHLIGRSDSSMYRAFLAQLNEINAGLLKVVGFTATPYRLDSGMLHEGKDRIFTDIAHDVPMLEMIKQGYLCPVIPKQTTTQLDVSGVGTRGGEFIPGQLEAAVDQDAVNRAAVAEIMEHGKDRGSWLVFAAGVKHAEHLRDILREEGISCEVVTGETPAAQRDRVLGDFKAGRLRCITNVGVLTTGFDAPGTDLIALLRPTQSAGLFVQMIGRGTRIAEGKDDCIAEGQRVLTDQGLVPIERVTTAMKVWDGASFVSHCGAILRGESEVISYAGITATPDHKVWTEKGWKALGQCALEQTAIAVTGYGGTPVRQDEGRFRRCGSEAGSGKAASAGGMSGLPDSVASGLFEPDGGKGWVPLLRETTAGAEVADDEGERCQAAMHQPEGCSLREVWRARHSVRVSVSDRDGCLGAGYAGPAPRNGIGQDQQRRAVCAGQPAVAATAAQPDEQGQQAAVAANAHVPIGTSRSPIFGCDDGSHVQRGDDRSTDRRAVEGAISKAQRRVWDILNAGPRHSFTVEGLLVHNCLVLDFAGNTMRHGPVDAIKGKSKKDKPDIPGEAPAKTCPECQTINHAAARVCVACNHEFPPPKLPIDAVASTRALLTTQVAPEWIDVIGVRYARHEKPGKPASLRVTYQCGLASHSEWICLEHQGFPRQKAEAWWRRRTDGAIPGTVEAGLAASADLRVPAAIQVRPVGQYTEIVSVRFPEGA